MFRLIAALVALASPAAAVTTTYFTFDYNMPDMAYAGGDDGQPGDVVPGFDITLFIQFDAAVSFLPGGTYSSAMPGVYLELPDQYDWDFHAFSVLVTGQFITDWSLALSYADGTGTAYGSDNGLDHLSVEPNTLFTSTAPGNWSSVAARQLCFDTVNGRPCSFSAPPPPQPVPLPAPALLLAGALACLIRRPFSTG